MFILFQYVTVILLSTFIVSLTVGSIFNISAFVGSILGATFFILLEKYF